MRRPVLLRGVSWAVTPGAGRFLPVWSPWPPLKPGVPSPAGWVLPSRAQAADVGLVRTLWGVRGRFSGPVGGEGVPWNPGHSLLSPSPALFSGSPDLKVAAHIPGPVLAAA